jgi:WD40 repeat protein
MVRDSSSMNGACLSFIIEKSHLLARGTVQWPAHKILLQLAIERADNDLLTLAAESWLNLGLCDWVWMRQINRPKRLQVSPLIAVMDGHSYQISKVVILPSFKAISWSYNKTIAFWNLIDGSLISKLNTFANSKGGLDGASMLTDSQIFCWSGFDLELWDIQKATQVSKLTEYSKRIIGAFSLNSKEILYWGHWGTGIWCPESNTTKMVQLSLNNYSFNSLELDNYRFVNFCKNKLQVIAKDTLQPVFELYHNDEIVGVEVIDKHRLCSWSMDRMIKIWNAITGEFEFEFQLETVMDKIEVLDAHTLAGSCSTLGGRWGLQRTHSIFIISISTRCVIQELVGHDSFISKVLRLPDSRLVSASGDTTLRLWREQGNEYIVEAIIGGHTGQINGAILLDNGFLLSWSDDNTIRIWDIDIATKQVYSESIPHYITNYLSFSSDKVVIAADCHMYTWQPLDSDPVVSMTASDGEKITNIKALPNDRVISASAKGLIQVWDIVTGNIEFEIYCGEPSSFEMLDHRRLLVRGSKTLQIWDLSNGQKLQTMATEITEFKYIPLRLSASLILNTRSNGGLEVWNLDSGVLVKELKSVHIHNNYIRTDTLGNDFFITIYDNTNNYGSTLCIWDLELLVLLHSIITPERINGVLRLSDDRVVCWGYSLVWVFDLHSFDLPLELQGHLSTTDVYLDYKCINGCIELTDGNFLTYSNDHTIRIWSGKENECELVFQGHTASVIYVKELPERRILSQSVNYEMIIWSMDSGEIIDRTKPEWLKQSELSSQWINSLAGTIEYRVNGPTRWDSLWVLQFNRNFLLGVYKGRSFRWYSTDQLRSPLCANGNAILAVSDRNVYRLGLWFGRDRIDIDLGVFVED